MRIAVLAGGLSSERDVSILSGSKIAQALRTKGHQVVLLDVYMGYEQPECDIDSLYESNYDFTDGAVISREEPDIKRAAKISLTSTSATMYWISAARRTSPFSVCTEARARTAPFRRRSRSTASATQAPTTSARL